MPTTTSLTPADVEAFGRELDKIRDQVIASLGEKDAAYIRGLIAAQRKLEIGGRVLLFAPWLPPAWAAGTAALATAKTLENMEIGHNVLHGQSDWMRTRRSTQRPGSRTSRPRPPSGSTRTTSCTTPGRTCSARTVTSAIRSCGSAQSNAGIRSTSSALLQRAARARLRIRHRAVRPGGRAHTVRSEERNRSLGPIVRHRRQGAAFWASAAVDRDPRVGVAAGCRKPPVGHRRIHGELLGLGYRVAASTMWLS
jgi:hypothetical protein